MANMSYCRFQNTRADLKDCRDNIGDDWDLSYDEYRARRALIKLCVEIAEEWFHELEEPLVPRDRYEAVRHQNT